MKISTLIAAAGLAFAGIAGTTTAASANTVVVSTSASVAVASIQDRRGYRNDRRNDRGRWDRGHRGYDRGRHYNRGRYYRGNPRRCWTERGRYGRRVTVCSRRGRW